MTLTTEPVKAKNKGGRPVSQKTLQDPDRFRQYQARRKHLAEHKPTEEIRNQVMVLAYLRTPPRVIGMVLGIAGDILDRVYASELKHGANIVTAKLGMRAVAAALKGDKAALTLIARAQGVGKPEKPDDIPTNDPKKVEDEPIDLAKFSLADLQGILKELDS